MEHPNYGHSRRVLKLQAPQAFQEDSGHVLGHVLSLKIDGRTQGHIEAYT
jgi:hypothetical protein